MKYFKLTYFLSIYNRNNTRTICNIKIEDGKLFYSWMGIQQVMPLENIVSLKEI